MAKQSKKENEMRKAFLDLLRVPAVLRGVAISDQKRDRALNARIIGLGFGVACSRCGGTGHYSFNQISGTVCFGCDGFREIAPKLTPELWAGMLPVVESGALDTYLANVRARQAAEKAAKGALDAVMNAWQACKLDDHYNWHSNEQPHRDISNLVNKPMSEAYTAVSQIAREIDRLTYALNGGSRNSKPLTQEQRAEFEAQRAAKMAEIVVARDAALALIAEKFALIPSIKAAYEKA